MGPTRPRRSAAVRESLPRRLPGGTELDHDSSEARELPRAPSRTSTPTRVARFTARDVNRLLKDEGIVRHRGKIESTINNAHRAIELRDEFGSLSDYFWTWQPDREVAPEAHHARSAEADGDDAGISGAEQGPAEARLDVRRTDNDLRVHAGDGIGQ